jgi:hypothetical protein
MSTSYTMEAEVYHRLVDQLPTWARDHAPTFIRCAVEDQQVKLVQLLSSRQSINEYKIESGVWLDKFERSSKCVTVEKK